MSEKTHHQAAGTPLNWLRAIYCNVMRPKDRANEKRVGMWCAAWVLVLIACGAPVQFGWIEPPLAWALAIVPLAPGWMVVRSYLKLLREADEMLRQLQFEALAAGFGAGLVSGMTTIYMLPPGMLWGMIPLLSMCFGFIIRILIAGREAARDNQ